MGLLSLNADDIYLTLYMGEHILRDIETSEARHAQIMDQFAALSDDCAENLWRYLRWLADGTDPDADELCGWLAGRYAVYALRIPGCRPMCLISADMDAPGRPLMWHGVSRGVKPCAEARLRCAEDRRPAVTTWEPKQ